MKNIKSNYLIQDIFSLLNKGRKFKLVKYNKNLQNILGINLIDFKHLSGKYIIYEINGKGKEYNFNDELVFEGEYLNEKRNGKGKEYNYDGNLVFEGEYLYSKRNGIGKEYNYDGKLVFEGEYLNGKSWNGKGYDMDENNVYILKDGKGFVKEYYCNDKLQFEGEFLNGEKNGKGKE